MVWVLALSGSVSSGHCPWHSGFVDSDFSTANLNAAGTNWSCGRLPQKSTSWNSAFDVTDGSCTGAGTNDVATFQRSFDPPLTILSVGVCKNGNDTVEDIKLASGDLFVRGTIGFDKTKSCG